MTKATNPTPIGSYGVLVNDDPASALADIAEQIKRIGYAILDSGYTNEELSHLSEAFNRTRNVYVKKYGEELLRSTNEFHTVRAPLAHGDPVFVRLAANQNLLSVLGQLIVGKFILNQQNGVINPPGEPYNQGTWHRDLPYQHYVSNTPLAVTALFCVDAFTPDNGATYVLPATHQSVNYPSASYIQRNAVQIDAQAGQFILFDSMLFHSGGFNSSTMERRAVNHVYTIPYFKQQIKLPALMQHAELDQTQKELLGFGYQEPTSIAHYLNSKL